MSGLRLLAAVLLVAGCAAEPPARVQLEADVPRTLRPFADDPQAFHFAILADRTGGHRPGVFEQGVDLLNRLRPAFVLCVGDLIEGYSEDRERLTEEWREIDAMVERLEMPFFYTVGNHDLGNAVMREVWGERNGREYWAFLYRDVLFVSLSTEDPPIALPPDIIERQARLERLMREDPERVQRMLAERGAAAGPPPELPAQISISEAQLDWLAAVLSRHRDVRWTFLLMHKPAWKEAGGAFERIEEMLGDRPYTAIAGHEHYYDHELRGGRDHVVLSTTGGIWLSPGPGSVDHVTWVTMGPDGPVLTNIRLDGVFDERGPR